MVVVALDATGQAAALVEAAAPAAWLAAATALAIVGQAVASSAGSPSVVGSSWVSV